ncbi:WXG100 family type VII secretion target [Nocardia sp. NPDC058658]|uniref:WXG100 family type VII secretion target n=1 Tax=Nocardia sp. NPDC058658 TaxID=3346580 RepID=UPI0036696E46
MDYGEIKYNFEAIDDAGTGLQKDAQDIATALQDLENLFQDFIVKSFPEGEGSGAFSILQTKWSGQSVELNQDLQAVGAKVVSGGQHMADTDKALAKFLLNG